MFSERYLRVMPANWLEPNFGTSAGTSLGPLLFVMHTHDVPQSVMPKFVDDLVAIEVDEEISVIDERLQNGLWVKCGAILRSPVPNYPLVLSGPKLAQVTFYTH